MSETIDMSGWPNGSADPGPLPTVHKIKPLPRSLPQALEWIERWIVDLGPVIERARARGEVGEVAVLERLRETLAAFMVGMLTEKGVLALVPYARSSERVRYGIRLLRRATELERGAKR